MRQKLCLLLAGLLFLLTGCGTTAPDTQEELPSSSQEVFAMDTYMSVTAYGDQAEEAVSAAIGEIQRLDALWSVGSADSEVSILNDSGSMLLSPETAELVELSMELFHQTDGAFDITVYPLMAEWGFPSGNYQVPSDQQLEVLLQSVGSDKLDYDPDTCQLTLGENMAIDLGGIAKGYASNRIMELFADYEVTSGLVSLGGNVQTYQTKPDGSLWRVAIENPDDTIEALADAEYIGVLSTADKAVITSGGYERYFEEDGVRYHHILDPATGKPANSGLISVTIVSENGTLADALSTTLFVMGKEKALDYWRSNSSLFDAVLVEEDGSITITEGLQDSFDSDLPFECAEK
jgi:thiamine biosynthesis lipoprotein